jgi:multidrug efflux pump subunit AcrB
VEADPLKMKGFNVCFSDIVSALQGADVATRAGMFNKNNLEITLTSSSFLTRLDDVKNLVLSQKDGKPVYLSEVAHVIDGPEEAAAYTRIGFSRYHRQVHGITGRFTGSMSLKTDLFPR